MNIFKPIVLQVRIQRMCLASNLATLSVSYVTYRILGFFDGPAVNIVQYIVIVVLEWLIGGHGSIVTCLRIKI